MRTSERLKGSLNLWQIVIMGLAYMAPMVVFDTFGIVSKITDGHVPTAYLIALAAMLFTAASYGKLVKAFPLAGSSYTFTQKSINPHLGFLVGWSALLDYLFLPMVNALLTKIYLSALFPSIPSWIWVVGFVGIVTLLNMRSVNILANLNTLLVLIQIVIMFIFIMLVIQGLHEREGSTNAFTFQPFFGEGMELSALVTGATILCFSFLGFDAITTLTEETANPTKIIPRAIFLTALLGGTIFVTTSFFIQSFFPDVSRFANPDAALPEIALYVGGKLFQSIFLVTTFVNTLASALASHASVSRLLYVMGRDNVFPEKWFGYIHPRWKTPTINVVLVGVISLSAMFFDLVTATALINFGALIAFTFVNISVISHFVIRQKKHRTISGFINYLILPVIGAGTLAVLWINLETSSLVLGIIWATIGLCYLLYMTKMFRYLPPQLEQEGKIEM